MNQQNFLAVDFPISSQQALKDTCGLPVSHKEDKTRDLLLLCVPFRDSNLETGFWIAF
jgi:hypothetical protein